MHNQKHAKSIGLMMMILTASLAVLSTLLSDSLTSIQTTTSLKPFMYAYGEEQSGEEHLLSS